MKSIVDLVVHAPQAEVAALFCDPCQQPAWMEDIARVEPVRGEPGEPSSAYRLVPKDGSEPFVATVVARQLPTRLSLVLERSDVTVRIEAKFVRLGDVETQLLSEETFRFHGVLARLGGLLGRRAIHRVHTARMEAFKHFAEARHPELMRADDLIAPDVR